MSERTVKLLRKHGINPSSQRVRIYDYLVASKNHPTVDDIYAELQKEGHLFSRATVYNTVKLFHDKHLIQNVKVEPHEMRYDASPGFHAHFKCESCGVILDVPMIKPVPDDGDECRVNHTSVTYTGLCRDCLQKNQNG